MFINLSKLSVSTTLLGPNLQSADIADCTCLKSRQQQRGHVVSLANTERILLQVAAKEDKEDDELEETSVENYRFHGKQVDMW